MPSSTPPLVDRIAAIIEAVNARAAFPAIPPWLVPIDKKPIHVDWRSGSAYGAVYRFGRRIGSAVSHDDGTSSISIAYRGQTLELTRLTHAELMKRPHDWADLVDREAAARDQVPAPLAVAAE